MANVPAMLIIRSFRNLMRFAFMLLFVFGFHGQSSLLYFNLYVPSVVFTITIPSLVLSSSKTAPTASFVTSVFSPIHIVPALLILPANIVRVRRLNDIPCFAFILLIVFRFQLPLPFIDIVGINRFANILFCDAFDFPLNGSRTKDY
jgi:hypothetical protein